MFIGLSKSCPPPLRLCLRSGAEARVREGVQQGRGHAQERPQGAGGGDGRTLPGRGQEGSTKAAALRCVDRSQETPSLTSPLVPCVLCGSRVVYVVWTVEAVSH